MDDADVGYAGFIGGCGGRGDKGGGGSTESDGGGERGTGARILNL